MKEMNWLLQSFKSLGETSDVGVPKQCTSQTKGGKTMSVIREGGEEFLQMLPPTIQQQLSSIFSTSFNLSYPGTWGSKHCTVQIQLKRHNTMNSLFSYISGSLESHCLTTCP
ncbi:hypothetical protein KIL84_014249 [Mauremys mutica]|uniref:Uncharacterized protein n=1 Tax=Mauremys mutica TaxID=74926 RepID=A0A9D3XPD2_9SAUR|nr:hypothetical protein KIL84_014249 [Mauremys mutica]